MRNKGDMVQRMNKIEEKIDYVLLALQKTNSKVDKRKGRSP